MHTSASCRRGIRHSSMRSTRCSRRCKARAITSRNNSRISRASRPRAISKTKDQSMSYSGLQNYRTMGAYGNLADATPYQVVQVMLDAVLARIAEATGHLERGEVSAKGEKIGKALGIIEALTLGLD